MNRRTALAGSVLTSVFLIAGAAPLSAQNSPPSAAAIARGLHPMPNMGESQGIPQVNPMPPVQNENLRNTSAPGAGATPPSAHRHQPAPRMANTAPSRPSAGHAPSVSFNSIQFAFGSARLTPGSSATLNNLGEALTHQLADQKKFLIEGHTDAAGGLQYNMTLSRRRADAVKDYLVREAGVSAARLETVGKGPTEPIDPRHPYAAANRRVVVVNLGG